MVAQLPAFVAVSLIVICSPGPDTALTVRNALAGGRRAGMLTAAGVCTGLMVWTLAAAAGVAALLAASEPAFRAVQLAGALYLAYLGARALWTAWRGGEPGADAPRVSGRALRQGLVSNLANPKIGVFFLALLPQFTGNPVLLGAVFCLLTFAWLGAYTVAVDGARRLFVRPAVRRTMDAVTGAVLVGFGVRLAGDAHGL